jgi:hypothetical protein
MFKEIKIVPSPSLSPPSYLIKKVWAMWLLIWWPLEVYMVVNFRVHGINQGVRKLAQTPTLN